MKESKVFDVKDFVSSRDLNSLPEGERTLIKRIHTLKECENVFERRDVIFTNEFLNYLNQIKAGLEGFISTQIDDIEWRCFQALCHYEGVRREIENSNYIAQRLRNAGKTKSWKSILERTVSKPLKDETTGFTALRKGKRLDASFEVFILSNPDAFTDKAVASSYKRLFHNGWTFENHAR
jgi:hypothetical protein